MGRGDGGRFSWAPPGYTQQSSCFLHPFLSHLSFALSFTGPSITRVATRDTWGPPEQTLVSAALPPPTMAALPGEDPEAHSRPKMSSATEGVAVEGCYSKAATTAEGSTCSTTPNPEARCCGKLGGPSSPETLCYSKAPLLPAWLHADVAAAVAGSCKEGAATGKSFNWYAGAAGASPAAAGGWRSPPMCSTAVSPSSRCEQLSCCGSPASRWGECCCFSGLQLQQLRCTDTPTVQLAAPSAGDSPLVLHATPLVGGAIKEDSEGPTTVQGPHPGAADAGTAAELRAVVLREKVANSSPSSAAEDRDNTTDTKRRGQGSRRSPSAPASHDIAPVAVAGLSAPATEASPAAAEASSAAAAAAGSSTSSTCSPPPEAAPQETPASYTAEAAVKPAAAPPAEATAATTEAVAAATPEGDTEGWISVKPRRQRRWADVPVSEDETNFFVRSPQRPLVLQAIKRHNRERSCSGSILV